MVMMLVRLWALTYVFFCSIFFFRVSAMAEDIQDSESASSFHVGKYADAGSEDGFTLLEEFIKKQGIMVSSQGSSSNLAEHVELHERILAREMEGCNLEVAAICDRKRSDTEFSAATHSLSPTRSSADLVTPGRSMSVQENRWLRSPHSSSLSSPIANVYYIKEDRVKIQMIVNCLVKINKTELALHIAHLYDQFIAGKIVDDELVKALQDALDLVHHHNWISQEIENYERDRLRSRQVLLDLLYTHDLAPNFEPSVQ